MNHLQTGLVRRLAIGVVGPYDLVEQVMLAGHENAQRTSEWQLVAVAYRDEHEATELVKRLRSQLDAFLFTGPLPYDIAREAGVLNLPAAYVPINDAALYRTLLAGMVEGNLDVKRLSVDTLTEAEVAEAYAEIGAPVEQISVRPYRGPEPSAAIVQFHEQLWREGATSAAITGIRSVWERLREKGIPALRMSPTRASVRAALQTAALMGLGSHLADSQIAVALVESPATREARDERPIDYWREEIKLSFQQVLIQEARRLGATVQPYDDHAFLIVTTVGALAEATNGFRIAPFLDRARKELGVGIHVGVGIGGTARDAATRAAAALERAREIGSQGFVLQHAGELVVLPGEAVEEASATAPPVDGEGMDLLRQLIAALDAAAPRAADQPYIVFADEVAELLGVTARSARRALRTLTDDGLAWPLPPGRSAQRGRPRHRFRLIAERLPPARQHAS